MSTAAIGPIITLAVWAVIIAWMIARDAPWFEVLPIVVGIAMIQLLLELHTPWLGDAVASGLHVVGAGALWLRRRLTR